MSDIVLQLISFVSVGYWIFVGPKEQLSLHILIAMCVIELTQIRAKMSKK